MRILPILATLALLCGCTTTQTRMPGAMAAIAPSLSVEGFLQASNQRDLHTMARIFGTEAGPVSETGGAFGCAFKKVGSWIGLGESCVTLQDLELEMDLIAQILAHDDFTIESESPVPGRREPTTRVDVSLSIGGRDYRGVPFMVVRSKEGRWLVEEIGLEKITG